LNIIHQNRQEKILQKRKKKKQKKLEDKGIIMNLNCITIKNGKECIFMTLKGCFFDGGKCDPIVEQCNGCLHIEEFPDGKYCDNYASPAVKWSSYACNRATHIIKEKEDVKFVDPLKASKRAMKKHKK